MNDKLIISKYKELVEKLTEALDFLADNNLIKERKDNNDTDNAPLIDCVNKSAKLRKELSLLQEQEEKEPVVTIPKWQMVAIEDVLRQASNIHHSQKKETCFDRCVCKAWKWTRDSLDKEYSFDTIPLDQSGIREELIRFALMINCNLPTEFLILDADIDEYLKSNQ